MIKIYGRITAFNVLKVLWFLEELKLNFELVELGGDFGGLDSKEFLEKNINGTIPVLEDGGKYIWESHTILRYLASKYGHEDWYKEDTYERSLYERWMDWGHTYFQPIFMKLFWGYYRMPEVNHNWEMINENIELSNKCLGVLDETIGSNRYIIGNGISLSDICVGSILFRLTNIGLNIQLPQNVKRWYKELQERDGYKKWVMSNFSSLKGKTTY